MNQQQIEAGFDPVQAERCPRAHRDQARDPGFCALNPHLTISGAPIPFDDRLAWIRGWLGLADLWDSGA